LPIATSDQPVTSPNKYRRDADDFATDMRARQATPSVDQGTELSGTTQNLDDQIIIQAQGAATRLIAGASWQDWSAVARAYQIARNRAQYEAGTNQPKGANIRQP
jgi:hypothetical protein